jgi:hypothetical protein
MQHAQDTSMLQEPLYLYWQQRLSLELFTCNHASSSEGEDARHCHQGTGSLL